MIHTEMRKTGQIEYKEQEDFINKRKMRSLPKPQVKMSTFRPGTQLL